MKKLLFLLICLCSLTKLTAQQSSGPAVSFVSYEQNWSDREGSLALRNNTNKRIFNISFQLVYYNMDGQQIDYENFFRTVSIDAGMTRKVDVPAYERDRNYAYYKSNSLYGRSHQFKVKFRLLDYNRSKKKSTATASSIQSQKPTDSHLPATHETPLIEETTESDTEYESDADFGFLIAGILMILFIVWYISLYFKTIRMARQRNRSDTLWLIFSIITSPILTVILLYILGSADDHQYWDRR